MLFLCFKPIRTTKRQPIWKVKWASAGLRKWSAEMAEWAGPADQPPSQILICCCCCCGLSNRTPNHVIPIPIWLHPSQKKKPSTQGSHIRWRGSPPARPLFLQDAPLLRLPLSLPSPSSPADRRLPPRRLRWLAPSGSTLDLSTREVSRSRS
jgi:hypothetical protein